MEVMKVYTFQLNISKIMPARPKDARTWAVKPLVPPLSILCKMPKNVKILPGIISSVNNS